MDSLEKVRKRLMKYGFDQIIFSTHAFIRYKQRMLDIEDIKGNLVKPSKLYNFVKEEARFRGEDKYKLFFKSSKKYDLIVIIVFLNNHIEIVTTWLKKRSFKPKYIKSRK
jgi:hypothetical protein